MGEKEFMDKVRYLSNKFYKNTNELEKFIKEQLDQCSLDFFEYKMSFYEFKKKNGIDQKGLSDIY